MIAVVFVSAPFHIRGSLSAFEAVDPNLIAAARTLGARPGPGASPSSNSMRAESSALPTPAAGVSRS